MRRSLRSMSASAASAGGRLLIFGDTLQDDFAKRTIVHQMVQGETCHPRAFPDEVCHVDRGLASGGIAQREQNSAGAEAAQCLTGDGAADAVDDDIDAPAGVIRRTPPARASDVRSITSSKPSSRARMALAALPAVEMTLP